MMKEIISQPWQNHVTNGLKKVHETAPNRKKEGNNFQDLNMLLHELSLYNEPIC